MREFLKTRSYETSKQEELLYEFVAAELETGSLSKGLDVPPGFE